MRRTQPPPAAALVGAFLAAVGLAALLGLASLIAPASACGQAPLQLTRGPYLQDVTTTSALVCWDGSIAHRGVVAYGSSPVYSSRVTDDAVQQSHCIRLAGLQPYSVYHYRVESEGSALNADTTFRTAGGPDQAAINFVAWGDNRSNPDVHSKLTDLITPLAPDFVVNIGDIVYVGTDRQEWDAFFDIERELLAEAPIYPCVGNHEAGSPLFLAYFHPPGEIQWYSFESGPAHISAVDLYSPYGPGSEQYNWLDQDLRSAARPWKIVFFHEPPYGFTPARGPNLDARAALTPLFEKYGVQLVLTGHDHLYQRNVVKGITYLITGGGGAPLHPADRGPITAYTESTYHFVKLSIKDGTLTSTAVRLDGTEFDRFTLTLGIPATLPGGPLTPTIVGSSSPVPTGGPGGLSTPLPESGGTPTAVTSVPEPDRNIGGGLLERAVCSRCHQPFLASSRQLLLMGWTAHSRVLLIGSISLALAIAVIVLLVGLSWGGGHTRKNRERRPN